LFEGLTTSNDLKLSFAAAKVQQIFDICKFICFFESFCGLSTFNFQLSTKKITFFLHISKITCNFAADFEKGHKMPSAEVQNMIPQIQRFFETQPVNRAYLFGSCSRGEETKDSDVDIMVDLERSATYLS
jgi:hypothetical protein